MSDQIQFAPFRDLNDFVGKAENYAIPDLKDMSKLSNRITNNLLYYQTNYLCVFLIIFVMISMMHPVQFISGLVGFVTLFTAYIVLTNKNVELQRLKRDKPYINLAVILLSAGFIFNLMGALLTFLFSICLPLSLIFLHAGLRTRNLKNKLVNKIETIGISRTPMGFLLEKLGATNEIAS